MDVTQRTFRTLLLVGWLITLFIGVAHVPTLKFLPPELKTGYDVYIHASQNSPGSINLLINLLYLIFYFIISVGLFFFRKWARNLFLPSIVLGLLLVGVSRIIVDVAWINALKYVPSIISGIIWAAAYYSPLSRLFESKGDV